MSQPPKTRTRKRWPARFFPRALLIGALGLGLLQATLTCAEAGDSFDDLGNWIGQQVNSELGKGDNVGMVVGVIGASGTAIYGYGRISKDDARVPDGDTLFQLASVSKAFTGLLLADAVERGEGALDEPVQDWLPQNVRVPTRRGITITLRELALHTSGLPSLPDNLRGGSLNPYAGYDSGALMQFFDHFALERDPGAISEYCNLGFGILGYALSRHLGDSYEHLVERRIGDVLGMPSTRIHFGAEDDARLAKGYVSGSPTGPWMPGEVLQANGALISSAHDLLVLLNAELGRTRSPLDRAMRLTRQITPVVAVDGTRHPGRLGWDWVGWRHLISKAGAIRGFRSFIGYSSDQVPAGVVVLSNSTIDADGLGRRIFDRVRATR